MTVSAPATNRQIGAIHAAKARLGLDDDSYRDVLQAQTGKRSAKGLTGAEAERVRAYLNGLAPRPGTTSGRAPVPGAMKLDGPFAGICRALWIAAWNLGVTSDRTDHALVVFVRRQTHLAQLNWMRDPVDAHKVVEALKSWIDREAGGVDWDIEAANRRAWGVDVTRWRRIAVINAQARRLQQAGARGDGQLITADPPLTDAELDQFSAELGRRLRKALRPRQTARREVA